MTKLFLACQGSTVQQNAFISESEDADELGIPISKPKYPQYAVIEKRLESFKNWPCPGIKPELLVEAGFVYTGVADAVRCYHCGVGLRNWEPGDNPWLEHAKWYSKCPHILFVKGQSFINKVLNCDLIEEYCAERSTANKESRTEENVMKSAAAKACIQMGYNKNVVLKAIRRYIEHKGTDIAALCEELESLDDSNDTTVPNNIADSVQTSLSRSNSFASGTENESIEELLEENQRLKDKRACKICFENRASVVFLPCEHMFTCLQCASPLIICPKCLTLITGYVEALFASFKDIQN